MRTAGGRGTRVVLALAIVAVLAGDVALVLTRRDHGPRPDSGAASPSGAGSSEASALEAALPELVAFVEETRSLKFDRRPPVELLDDERFEAMLREADEAQDEQGGEVGREDVGEDVDDEAIVGVLRALGLVDGDVDLDAITDEQVSSVVGFYDDRAGRLYARGVAPTPYVKQVLVHELTHALEDQRFGLDRYDLDDEASAAFTALVEGSASWVERRWFESRSADERAAIESEAEEGAPELGADGPDVFVRLLTFPYAVGPEFVEAVLAAGGRARLDAAFAGPPTTTEHILHPDRYLAGDAARPVAEPRADGPVVDEGVLGEVGLFLVLDAVVPTDTAVRAAAGWGGDRYVAWNAGSRTCVRFNLVMDSSRDTTEVVSALRSWAGAHRGATVTGTDPVAVTACR